MYTIIECLSIEVLPLVSANVGNIVLYHCYAIFMATVTSTSLLVQTMLLNVSTNIDPIFLSSPDGPVQTQIQILTMAKEKPVLTDQTWCF